MGNYDQAVRAQIEQRLRCPKCPAANRPGATYIELDQDGRAAYCGVCSAHFTIPTERTDR